MLLQHSPNPPPSVQKSSTVHTPWVGVVNLLMTTRVLPKLRGEQADAAIRAWNHFSYHYAQETHKEYAIEAFACAISLVLKHGAGAGAGAGAEPLFDDWI